MMCTRCARPEVDLTTLVSLGILSVCDDCLGGALREGPRPSRYQWPEPISEQIVVKLVALALK